MSETFDSNPGVASDTGSDVAVGIASDAEVVVHGDGVVGELSTNDEGTASPSALPRPVDTESAEAQPAPISTKAAKMINFRIATSLAAGSGRIVAPCQRDQEVGRLCSRR